jgi:uncharacterized membrane protein
MSPGAALVAGFVIAVSPFHIHYSQEARFYGFLCLEAALFLFLATQLLWTAQRRWILPTFVVGLAGIYTHYYFGFLAVAIWTICILRTIVTPQSRRVLPWLALAAGLVAGYLPWLPILGRQLSGPGAGSTGPVTMGILQHTFRYFVTYGPDVNPWRALSFLFLLLVLLFGLVHWRWGGDHLKVFPLRARGQFVPSVGIALTTLLVFGTCTVKPLYIAKGMVIVLPAYAMIVAGTWERLRYWGTRAVFIALLLLIVVRGMIVFYGVPRNKDWPAVANLLADQSRPGDVLGLKEGLVKVPLHYYYLADRSSERLPELLFDSERQSQEEQVDALITGIAGAERFWLVRVYPPNTALLDFLSAHEDRFPLAAQWDFRGGLEVYLFRINRETEKEQHAFEGA